MDSVIALAGKGYVLMAADTSLARSIVIMKHDEDKILQLDSHKMMGMTGEQGDREQFGDYVQKNLELTFYRTGHRLSTKAASHWTRNQLARFLRSSPYQVNLLLGGYDASTSTASLYFLDYLASMHKVKFAAHGYAGYLVLGLMDKLYRDDMPLEEGLSVLRAAIAQVQRRFLVNAPNYIIKIVDADGYRVLETGAAPQ
mgnify:FL=1